MNANEIREKEHLHLKIVHEISDLINKSTGLDTIIRSVVRKIAASLHYDVVSIYVWNQEKEGLELKANKGLKIKPNSEIFLKSDEGLTGVVHKTKMSLVAMPASKHPRYRYFPEIGEEEYESYIGVPIILNNRCAGVLVGQNKEEKYINPAEETLFQIIALRLAGLLEVADKLDRLKTPSIKKQETRTYQGKGMSPGIAIGNAVLFRGLYRQISSRRIKSANPETEKKRIKKAINHVCEDLKNTIKELESENELSKSEIDIFEAHLMILNSPALEESIVKLIDENKSSAEASVVECIESLASQFESLEDTYLRERAQDFRDIGERLIRNLTHSGKRGKPMNVNDEDSIIVAKEIGLSFISFLNKNKIKAIVCEKGGETSHAVIIAKSLGIPVVIDIDNIFNAIHPGEQLIVDGKSGFIFTSPDEALKNEYLISSQKSVELKQFIEDEVKALPDNNLGVGITANIGFPVDIQVAKQYGIENVGLFRTEFAFTQFKKWPGVRPQVKTYKNISEEFNGFITLRTLDVGADKLLPYMKIPSEENPLLGLRAIRFSMEYLDLFRDQIKSVLLATRKGGKFRILLPMISNIWEVETAKQIIHELSLEVGLVSDDIPKLGVMLEVPALVYEIENYKDYIDFVSVGTNDLIQYLLAVDRNSNVVGHLYSSFHPSVIRVLDDIFKKVSAMKKELSICGEIAGSVPGALLILSLGYRNISVSPLQYPYIKYLVNRLDHKLLRKVRNNILKLNKESEIRRYINDILSTLEPKLLEIE
ncbi:MAG: phosphoenolpyruvate--protein phosphotransferase [Candidatus Dadabacteria bacterium]|nr:phosphoenolpyruvate--protein phosphotransferase [Candidatus Dadabacteria bacterium]NIQ14098.1 phosphoenolpyruvate--protein phosphotransferase [Candidatus Dadabacteria bacterium]